MFRMVGLIVAAFLVTGATTPLGTGIVQRLSVDETVDEVLALGIEPEEEVPRVLQGL